MESVSSASVERARKFTSLAMQRISAVGQNTVAIEIGVSPPTVSRFVSDDLERACLILATVGLKVVQADRVCVDKKMYESLITIARAAMANQETMQQLVWED